MSSSGCESGLICLEGVCSNDGVRSNLLEVYDPGANTISPLIGAEFPDTQLPAYPMMFLLPNGDVLYAGGEDATNLDQADGRVLIPDYNDPQGSTWSWSEHEISSSTTGASAVMYSPGQVLKTGGRGDFNNPD